MPKVMRDCNVCCQQSKRGVSILIGLPDAALYIATADVWKGIIIGV